VIRKLTSIGLYIVAGFFFYMVSILAFINDAPLGAKTLAAKTLMVAIFAIPAVLALLAGLAVGRFQNWRRNAGAVLLSATGVTLFVVFTVACLMTSDEFRRMMPPDTLTFFSDYITGALVIVVLAIGGALLLWANRRSVVHAADALSRVDAPRGHE
jgi:hypothetical protein